MLLVSAVVETLSEEAAQPLYYVFYAMALAADRDTIAREYTSRFALTFEVGAPALVERGPRVAEALPQRVVDLLLHQHLGPLGRHRGRPAVAGRRAAPRT